MFAFFRHSSSTVASRKFMPNRWDIFAILLIISGLALLAAGAKTMSGFSLGGTALPNNISLSLLQLPGYALQTVLRIFIALFFSLLFTFIIGTLAAKNLHAQKIIIPVIDILQSIPVMGFLTITVTGFIRLFPNSLWGFQCAAIFAVFTAQVWNMTLSFYQSLLTLPQELKEVANMFHLSSWQQFWRVEVPFAMPGLLWNTMLSLSASWFFVVASEAVTVSHQTIALPGIGSYIAEAIAHKNLQAIFFTIITMFLVILIYDQLLFRPLIEWADRFLIELPTGYQPKTSWLGNLFRRTVLFKYLGIFFSLLANYWINFRLSKKQSHYWITRKASFSTVILNKLNTVWMRNFFLLAWYSFLVIILFYAVTEIIFFMQATVDWSVIGHVCKLGLFTAARVICIVLLSTIIWVPLGIWIGLRPRWAEIVQPIAQFLAAFPVNLLFPLFVVVIVRYNLDVNIWTTPLMLLGTQWYILFNIIAGASALPKDIKQAADNFGLKGSLWWRRLALPAIFPYYITGAITAAGNAWNTSTVAEVVSWGTLTLQAQGLGAFIMHCSAAGNFPYLVLGICVMALFVLTLNRFLWRPLYGLAQSRYQME